MVQTVIPLASALIDANANETATKQTKTARAHQVLCEIARMGVWGVEGPVVGRNGVEEALKGGFGTGLGGESEGGENPFDKPWGGIKDN